MKRLSRFIFLPVVMLSAVICSAATSAGTGDQAVFNGVQSMLPEGETFSFVCNIRNVKYYGAKILDIIMANVPEDEEFAAFVEIGCKIWDLLGLDAIKAVGGADSEVSADSNVYESVFVAYSGKPLSGIVRETFDGSFDTVKAAGSWPVSTVAGYRGNFRLLAASKAVHENVEPLPPLVVDILKTVSGRYTFLVVEDTDGSVMVDCIFPDNEAAFVFFSLQALAADRYGIEPGKDMIVFPSSKEGFPFDLFVFRGRNMVRICNGADVPERIHELPKLKDDPGFAALTEGIDPKGVAVSYTGRKMLNPMWGAMLEAAAEQNAVMTEYARDILIVPDYDCTSFSQIAFSGKGAEYRMRTFGSYYDIVFRNAAVTFRSMVQNIISTWRSVK